MRRLYLSLLIVVAASVSAQRDFSKVEVKAAPVAGSVYMITGAGGNIGVSIGEDGIVLVDDQYAPLASRIEAALASITKKPLRFIINTHWHGDHTGGNEHFGKSGPIVAHENVRRRLQEGAPSWEIAPAAKGALPVLTFNDTVSIHLNGEDVRAVHFPHAHTDGDSVIWFTQSNVVHMGDNFFNGFFSFLEASRVELAPYGVGVTIVNPGFVATPMTARNRFRMPFLMNAEETAAIVADGLESGARVVEFPKPMSLLMRTARLIPDALYDRLLASAGRRKEHPPEEK